MFGVFDGHGEEGHKISHYVKKNVPHTILNKFIKFSKRTLDINFSSAIEPKITPVLKAKNDEETASERMKNISLKDMKEIFQESIYETDESLGVNGEYSGTTF